VPDLILSWIQDDHLCAALFCLQNSRSDQRVPFRCIGSDDEETVGIILELWDRVRHCSAPECCSQTGYGGSVSETGAVIDIIRPDHCAGKLLQKVIFLIGAFSGCQHRDAIWPTLGLDRAKFLCDTSERASSQLAGTNSPFLRIKASSGALYDLRRSGHSSL
jgi:hypothetical protein